MRIPFVTFLLALGSFVIFVDSPSFGVPIESANDGTGTRVRPNASDPNQFDITDGTRSGPNLFHSFEKLGLNESQIANFISTPNVENILGRVTGGQASNIDGLLRVTGSNANLYLMNPAGIVFGPNARLDLGGSFNATTATGIQMGDFWFNAFGSNDYENLIGNPEAFAFVGDELGSVVNAGSLEVPSGESITLLGGVVINTGTLTTQGGDITVASVPDEQLVRITPEGSLLSLGLPIETREEQLETLEGFEALRLPELLTGGGNESANGVVVADGKVLLTGSETVLPDTDGTTIASGVIDVSDDSSDGVGGNVSLLGERVGVVDAEVDASGDTGGEVLVGGDYKGEGVVPNAERTYVSPNSTFYVDGLGDGDAGRFIAWSETSTEFLGDVSAQGVGEVSDGGFIEISGRQKLIFDGSAIASSVNGISGTVLFDPENIIIVENSGTDDIEIIDGIILGSDTNRDNSDFIISAQQINNIDGSIIFRAKNNINIAEGVSLSLNDNSSVNNFLKFTADSDNDGIGSFTMDSSQNIITNGRSLNISASQIITGGISTLNDFPNENEVGDSVDDDENIRPSVTLMSAEDIIIRSIAGYPEVVRIRSQDGDVIVDGVITSDRIVNIYAGRNIQILGSNSFANDIAGLDENREIRLESNYAGISLEDFLISKGIEVREDLSLEILFPADNVPSSIFVASSNAQIDIRYGDEKVEYLDENVNDLRFTVIGDSTRNFLYGLNFTRIIDNGEPFLFEGNQISFEGVELFSTNPPNDFLARRITEELINEIYFNGFDFTALNVDNVELESSIVSGAVSVRGSNGSQLPLSINPEIPPPPDRDRNDRDRNDRDRNDRDRNDRDRNDRDRNDRDRNDRGIQENDNNPLDYVSENIDCDSEVNSDICEIMPTISNILDISDILEILP